MNINIITNMKRNLETNKLQIVITTLVLLISVTGLASTLKVEVSPESFSRLEHRHLDIEFKCFKGNDKYTFAIKLLTLNEKNTYTFSSKCKGALHIVYDKIEIAKIDIDSQRTTNSRFFGFMLNENYVEQSKLVFFANSSPHIKIGGGTFYVFPLKDFIPKLNTKGKNFYELASKMANAESQKIYGEKPFNGKTATIIYKSKGNNYLYMEYGDVLYVKGDIVKNGLKNIVIEPISNIYIRENIEILNKILSEKNKELKITKDPEKIKSLKYIIIQRNKDIENLKNKLKTLQPVRSINHNKVGNPGKVN